MGSEMCIRDSAGSVHPSVSLLQEVRAKVATKAKTNMPLNEENVVFIFLVL